MSLDPEKIGRYEVQCVLGRGAMGVVYLALDPLLKRSVAVKTMRDNGEDVANTMERFKREAEISARLNHPNIITVYDVGVDNQMGPFLAMEYVQGASLAHLIKENLPMDVALRLLLQGMAALKAAEQAGIVHRDIKPENMLVSLEGRLKLMDFGIARGDQSRLTAAGLVFGTPSYTAPELLVGGEPSPGTDRYAFAVTAFEAFTGTLPYQGTSVGTTLYRIVHEPPTMPPSLHPDLQAVFHRALAKDPAQRFRDVPGFMWALISAAPIASDQKAKLLDSLDTDQTTSGTFNFPDHSQNTPVSSLPVYRSGGIPATNSRDNSQDNSQEMISTMLADSGAMEPPPATSASAAPPSTSPDLSTTRSYTAPSHTAKVEAEDAIEDLNEPIPEPLLPTASEVLDQMVSSQFSEDATSPVLDIAPTQPVAKALAAPARKGGRGLLWAFIAVLLLGGAGVGGYLLMGAKAPPRRVDILSTPPGAKVTLEGQSLGLTPLNQVEVTKGATTLKVELGGYQPQTYRIKEGETLVNIVLELPPHTIAVVTDPVGAEAFLNGRSMGKTPIQNLGIPSEGSQQLRIIHDGYLPWEHEVDPGLPFPDVIRLTPAPMPKPKR